jgi:hypothetical protein
MASLRNDSEKGTQRARVLASAVSAGGGLCADHAYHHENLYDPRVPAHKSSRRIAARGFFADIGPKILSSDRGGFRSGCCSVASEKES